MARNKLTVEFTGYDVLKKQLDELSGKATEKAVESALKASQQVVAGQANEAITRHTKTGATQKSIIKNGVVRWTQDTAEIDVGFDIDNGGLPSIFLMYGTKLHGQPHVTPDRNLYNAVYGSKTRKEVKKIQEEVFTKVIERMTK